MNYTRKLFQTKDPYDLSGTDTLFVESIKENVRLHTGHCAEYRALLEREAFAVDALNS